VNNIKEILISPNSSIKDALRIIDSGAVKIALVVSPDGKFLGTLSDGDIRRALLKQKTIEDNIKDIYCKNSIFASDSSSSNSIIELAKEKNIYEIPILNDDFKVVDLFILNRNFQEKNYDNHVVLMVGGRGERLRPLTEKTPKPMLKVGGRPILETIVMRFVNSGFKNITMCLGYKSNLIQEYFKDGKDFRANIDYVIEDERMGTAGALSLLKTRPNSSFFVMNGDILTNIDFEAMLKFHKKNNSFATMSLREYDITVPYGVVEIEDEDIISIQEKPIHTFHVNAGIYMLEPDIIDFIPKNEFYDMPELFKDLLKENQKLTCFPLREYWLDIGRISDYERANIDYPNHINV